jgi:DNA-directed RNA polymerase specialized sigma subunit
MKHTINKKHRDSIQDDIDKFEHSEEGKELLKWLNSLSDAEQMAISIAIAERGARMIKKMLGLSSTIPAKRVH